MQKRFTPAPKQTEQKSQHPIIVQLQSMIPEIQRALPRHLNADRMARIVLTEFRKNPKLMECDPASLFGAILQCSQLGLEPGGALQHAWLIPRNRKGGGMECQLQIGYQGMIDLAERDGRVTIEAHGVYENELFDIDYGTDARIVHKPAIGKGRGSLIGAYALARYKDGRKKFHFLTIDEIEAARKRSQAGSSGPWSTDYDAMAIKTAIRRLFKYLPKSLEIAQALDLEEKAEMDLPQVFGNEEVNFETEIEESPTQVDPMEDVSK